MDKGFWQEKLKNLPLRPGVYLFKDGNGKIIYVGKADALKSRVSSYFREGKSLEPKVLAMRERAADLEYILVDSPAEALLLECNLIKLHRPHYNVMLKDDKTYPYLKLTWNEEYPRLLVSRNLRDDGGLYFGPYTNVSAMNETLGILRKVFPLRNCGVKPGRFKNRACLNHHLGQCMAPCIAAVSVEEYRKVAEDVIGFLHGNGERVKKDLQKKMAQAAAAMEYEAAAVYRDRLNGIDQVLSKQKITAAQSKEDRDFIAIHLDGDEAVAVCFFIRQGRLLGREHFFLEHTEDQPLSALYGLFLPSFYQGDRIVPPEIIVSESPDEEELLLGILKEKRGGRASLTVPSRGDKARLLDLAKKNGQLLMEEKKRGRETGEIEARGLEEIRVHLGFQATPRRIECYDISNIQGAYMVGSMVVFYDGKPQKSQYRKFKIKTVVGIDDFAALGEVLDRRFKRGVSERAEGKREGFGHLPDLVIIDGGKGQLSSALKIREKYELDIPFIGLAKREEEIILPHQSESLLLPKEGPAYHLVQRIRDEAHRFAITFHRSLRQKGQTKSVLDEIPGIGPKRRKALMKHFRTVKAIENASEEELALVETMNREAAASVYQFLRLKNKVEERP